MRQPPTVIQCGLERADFLFELRLTNCVTYSDGKPRLCTPRPAELRDLMGRFLPRLRIRFFKALLWTHMQLPVPTSPLKLFLNSS